MTLREERTLSVYQNIVLRRIFGPKRDEVTGEWGKLNNEELNATQYCGSDEIKKNGMGGACCANGERRGVYRVLVGKPEGKRPLGRPRYRWEDNIKMDLEEEGCGGYGLDRAGSGYGQVAGTCECGNEPSGSIKCGVFLDWLRTV